MGSWGVSSVSPAVLSITQLNRRVGELLQGTFSRIWVSGEVSNFTQAASGHWYFSIKDEGASVRAVMFRGRAQTVGFVPKPGEKFEFRATVTLYEPRGDYQLQVESLRRAGRGDLHEAFLALKDKLLKEGLFDPARKRPIPEMPRTVGVVTSLAAAALRDVLTAMARRAPHVPVIVYPAPVQGLDAADKLNAALCEAISRADADVILLVRGGGSIEDLWSFNDESLARTIAASPIPIVSGVGHETDFTIADFVADLRAPTPTAAAELCCKSRDACMHNVMVTYAALAARQQHILERAALRLDRAASTLISPRRRVEQQRERLDGLLCRLVRAARHAPDRPRARLEMLHTRLGHAQPQPGLLRQSLESRRRALADAARRTLESRRLKIEALSQTLEALGPRSVLERGYAIVRKDNGEIVKNALDLSVGEQIGVELGRGSARVSVLKAHGLL